MSEKLKADLFNFIAKEHKILLTGKDLEKIIQKCNKNKLLSDNYYENYVSKRLNTYRIINVFIFSLLGLTLPLIGVKIVVLMFALYNLTHVIINNIKRCRH